MNSCITESLSLELSRPITYFSNGVFKEMLMNLANELMIRCLPCKFKSDAGNINITNEVYIAWNVNMKLNMDFKHIYESYKPQEFTEQSSSLFYEFASYNL